jgi:hypothetical protein
MLEARNRARSANGKTRAGQEISFGSKSIRQWDVPSSVQVKSKLPCRCFLASDLTVTRGEYIPSKHRTVCEETHCSTLIRGTLVSSINDDPQSEHSSKASHCYNLVNCVETKDPRFPKPSHASVDINSQIPSCPSK